MEDNADFFHEMKKILQTRGLAYNASFIRKSGNYNPG